MERADRTLRDTDSAVLGVTVGWSCLTGLGSARVLGWLRHSQPGLFDGNAGTMDPKLVARQEPVKARLAGGWAGSG